MEEFHLVKRIKSDKSIRFQIDERGSKIDMQRALKHYFNTWDKINGAIVVLLDDCLEVALEKKDHAITYKVISFHDINSLFKSL